MNMAEVKKLARERMKGFCNLCPECNGVWCSGKVPGMGGCGSGEGFKRNFKSLREIKIRMKTIHDVKNPRPEVEILGRKLDLPIMIAPVTGSEINMGGYLTEDEYIDSVVFGAIGSNTIAMIGDSGNPSFYEAGIEATKKAGGEAIAIIKPRENEEIIKRIRMAEEAGAIAVGIDIDGAGLITMKLFGQPVGPKSIDDLKEIIASTKLPFILKGIMTVEEAKIAVEVGASAIIVSNHGGRVLNHVQGVAEVLEDIAREVKGKIAILADCNVREGVDAYKYLALGADCVLIARPAIWGAVAGKREGVKTVIEAMKNQLTQAMILTGTQTIEDISAENIVKP